MGLRKSKTDSLMEQFEGRATVVTWTAHEGPPACVLVLGIFGPIITSTELPAGRSSGRSSTRENLPGLCWQEEKHWSQEEAAQITAPCPQLFLLQFNMRCSLVLCPMQMKAYNIFIHHVREYSFPFAKKVADLLPQFMEMLEPLKNPQASGSNKTHD